MQEAQEAWVWKMPWSREWHPTPVFLPGKFHGQRGLAGHSPKGHKESDTTEQLNTSTSVLAWRIPWTEEPGGLQSHKELDTTECPSRNVLEEIYLCVPKEGKQKR